MPLGVTNLVGFGAKRAAAGGGGGTITFNEGHGEENTDGTITIPSGWAVGSLVVACFVAEDSTTTPTDVSITGWTKVGTEIDGTNFARCTLYAKVLAGGEPGSTITGPTGDSAEGSQSMINFDYTGTITLGANDYSGDYGSAFAPADQTINAAGETGLPLVMIAVQTARLAPTFTATGYSYYDFTPSGGTNVSDHRWAYEIVDSSPSDDTITFTDGGNSNCAHVCYLTFE